MMPGFTEAPRIALEAFSHDNFTTNHRLTVFFNKLLEAQYRLSTLVYVIRAGERHSTDGIFSLPDP
jgi:hypothetical protein